jgi:hypothetical protein
LIWLILLKQVEQPKSQERSLKNNFVAPHGAGATKLLLNEMPA